jgi:hypothetical protein
MPTVKVPIFESVYTGVDEVELTEQNFKVTDGYRTAAGGTVSRPGSKALFTANAASGFGVDGMLFWPEKSVAMVAGGGELYQLSYTSNVPQVRNLTGGAPLLNTNVPVSMVTDGTNLYCCNGGRIVYTPVGGTPSYIPDQDAPTGATHLAYLDGYVLAIDGSNRWFWSDVNAGTSWNALNFASASGSPDNLVALKVYNREIYLFGQRSVEIWENDGTTPFTRIPGGFIQSGCCAPYSVITDENSLYWLDENRRLVQWNGKTVQRLSTKYDRQFQSLAFVNDAVAFKIAFDGYVFFVFQFRLANRTFVYNQTTDDWSEWGSWNFSDALYDRWIGAAYVYAESWGLHLIGRRDTLVVSELSNAYTSDDGAAIAVDRITGHLDFGTSKRKQSNELRFRARRGDGLSERTPVLMVRHKIDNRHWSNWKEFSLGKIGEYDLILRDIRRNQFRTKQYHFRATDAVSIVFSQAEEDIEVLR